MRKGEPEERNEYGDNKHEGIRAALDNVSTSRRGCRKTIGESKSSVICRPIEIIILLTLSQLYNILYVSLDSSIFCNDLECEFYSHNI